MTTTNGINDPPVIVNDPSQTTVVAGNPFLYDVDATDEDGDFLITGSIIAYRRSAVSFQPRDILSVRDFEVELITRVRATERASGQVLIDRELTGRTTVRLGGDLASSERQALPLLADDLAKQTVAMLAEGGW